jgi:hypothetical protein
MCVDDHAFLHSKCVAEHNICGLPRDPSKCQQRFHAAWYFAAKISLQCAGGFHNCA